MTKTIELNGLSRKALMQSLQMAIAEATPAYIADQKFKNAPEWKTVNSALRKTRFTCYDKSNAKRFSQLGKIELALDEDIANIKKNMLNDLANTQTNLDKHVQQEIEQLTHKSVKDSEEVKDLYSRILKLEENKKADKMRNLQHQIIKYLCIFSFVGFVIAASFQIGHVSFANALIICGVPFILNIIVKMIREEMSCKRIRRQAEQEIKNQIADKLKFYQSEVLSVQEYYQNDWHTNTRYPLPLNQNYFRSEDRKLNNLIALNQKLTALNKPLAKRYEAWVDAETYRFKDDNMIDQFPKQFQNINSLLLINGMLESQRAQNWSEAVNLVISDQFNERQLLALYDLQSDMSNMNDLVQTIATQGSQFRFDVTNQIEQTQQQNKHVQHVQQQTLTHQAHQLDDLQTGVSALAIMSLLNNN